MWRRRKRSKHRTRLYLHYAFYCRVINSQLVFRCKEYFSIFRTFHRILHKALTYLSTFKWDFTSNWRTLDRVCLRKSKSNKRQTNSDTFRIVDDTHTHKICQFRFYRLLSN